MFSFWGHRHGWHRHWGRRPWFGPWFGPMWRPYHHRPYGGCCGCLVPILLAIPLLLMLLALASCSARAFGF